MTKKYFIVKNIIEVITRITMLVLVVVGIRCKEHSSFNTFSDILVMIAAPVVYILLIINFIEGVKESRRLNREHAERIKRLKQES